jgi:hypothetical protein
MEVVNKFNKEGTSSNLLLIKCLFDKKRKLFDIMKFVYFSTCDLIEKFDK